MTERNIWVISDTHWGHENIIKFCNRPFSNLTEMNEAMVENWNRVVKPQDKVYHLGDVYFGKRGQGYLKRLNGHKRLVIGNHDEGTDPEILDNFDKISAWRMFPEFGLLLTHVPVYAGAFGEDHAEGRRSKYSINVHGHLHLNTVKDQWGKNDDKRYRCVSVEHINYTPINIEELRVK